MAKQNGLGDNLYVGNFNVSGAITAIDNISGGNSPLEVTAIDKSAKERIGGLRDGAIEATTWFDPTVSHPVFSTLPRTDVIVSYFRSTSLGAPAASSITKQIGYDGQRSQDGSFTFKLSCQANGTGIEWGRQLTAGVRTDTTATNGIGIDTLASAAFGAQAYLHVFGVTGTSVTVKIQDSADNATFADVTGLSFTAATGATTERVNTSNTATIRRYVRVVTTGTFTNAQFAVNFIKNDTAGISF